MDKTTKTILIVIASLIVLCICASVAVVTTGLSTYRIINRNIEHGVSDAIQENHLKPLQVGGEITDYIVPEGFNSAYNVHIGNGTLFGFKSQNKKTLIILAQFPQEISLDLKETMKLIKEASDDPNSTWFNAEMKEIEQIPVTISGLDTMLTISEGISSDGDNYRIATANFKGRGGPALLMIASPVDEWDMEIATDFISSIQ